MAQVKERVNPMFAIETLIERLSDRRFDRRFGFGGDLDGTETDDAYMQRPRPIQSICRKLRGLYASAQPHVLPMLDLARYFPWWRRRHTVHHLLRREQVLEEKS